MTPFAQPTLVHLIGTPGAGKYTIAKELAALTGARLVDNHAIANVIFNLVEQDGVTPLPPEIWPRVGAVRRAVLDTLVQVSPPHLSFIFTNYLRGADEAETAMFEEMSAIAEIRGSRFVPVLVRCETPELRRRVVAASRRERMKLTDPAEAARLNGGEVPLFETADPRALTLDATSRPPAQSAAEILAWADRPA